MSKIPETEREFEFMVNCKTYPAVSQKYIETVCTGGVEANGDFVRLYPVPFRFLEGTQRYKRWDIIRVRAHRTTKDTRPESWHLSEGCEIKIVKRMTTHKRQWEWMRPTVHQSTQEMAERGVTNGCVEIIPLEFYSEPDKKRWTPSQLNVFKQKNLFISDEVLQEIADHVPWKFKIKYQEKHTGVEGDLKVLAWSYYQGVRRNMKLMSEEDAVRAIENKVKRSIFSDKNTVFAIFGTHSRLNHWMISALYHVPTKVITEGARLF